MSRKQQDVALESLQSNENYLYDLVKISEHYIEIKDKLFVAALIEVKATHRVDDAAKSLKNEHRCSVVIQVVPLCSLYAHCHESFGFRLGSYEQYKTYK